MMCVGCRLKPDGEVYNVCICTQDVFISLYM